MDTCHDGRVLVDCDIHVGYETIADLLPYLDGPTRELVISSGTNGLAMPSYPWNHPTGWFRHDVYERSAAHDANFAYLSLDLLRERHLDMYEVTLGIVEPDEAAAFSILPNAHLAARLCSAYNDWLLEHWLQEEPRLRGMLVVPAQYPKAAADEIRRLGGRDEFVGVFLPGGARIPYGNPVYDPLWAAADELGLPVAVHTHYESVGISPPITPAGMPDYYVEYHTLCGAGMYGHFVSILCHGVFERFPNVRVAMIEGGLVPYVGFLWRLDTNWRACRSRSPGASGDRPSTSGSTSASRPSRSSLRTTSVGFWPRSSSCARGTRSCTRATSRTGTSTSPSRRCGSSPRTGATTSAGATPASSSASRRSLRRDGRRARDTPPLTEAPVEGSVRMLEIGTHRIGLYRVSGRLYALEPVPASRRAALLRDGRGSARDGRGCRRARHERERRALPVAQVGVRHRVGSLARRRAPTRSSLCRVVEEEQVVVTLTGRSATRRALHDLREARADVGDVERARPAALAPQLNRMTRVGRAEADDVQVLRLAGIQESPLPPKPCPLTNRPQLRLSPLPLVFVTSSCAQTSQPPASGTAWLNRTSWPT